MLKRWCRRRREIERTFIAFALLTGFSVVPGLADTSVALQLEVLLNGKPSGLIGSFLKDEKGRLSAKRKELEELHLKVPDEFGAEDEVALAALPGVSYRYDDARQSRHCCCRRRAPAAIL